MRGETVGGTCNYRWGVRKNKRARFTVPLCKCVKRLVGCLGDNGDLIAAHGINETAALHDGLRTDQDKVHLFHDVRHSGIQNHRTWNTSGVQSFGCLDSEKHSKVKSDKGGRKRRYEPKSTGSSFSHEDLRDQKVKLSLGSTTDD